jgi:hypothetical protein
MYLPTIQSNKLATQVADLLATQGLLSSPQIQLATGASQSAVSRAIAALANDPIRGLKVFGRARSTRYALGRSILGRRAATQPIFVTDALGQVATWGTLQFLAGGQLVVQANPEFGPFESVTQARLPWFMAPLKPQGFMGRLRGQQLGYADANPDQWNLEQTLNAIIAHEHDTPGALTLGEERGEPYSQAPENLAQRALHYDTIAQNVALTLPAGSSAGGEQAKFVTCINSSSGFEHLIVKFTPPRTTPFGESWHDLLYAESLALSHSNIGPPPATPSRNLG